jgi:hypothetical protein
VALGTIVIDAEAAFDLLKRRSQVRNKPLAGIALLVLTRAAAENHL